MKHRLLSKCNMLLSSLALLLAGCGTTQKGAQSMKFEQHIMALYGVPMEQYQKIPTQEADSTNNTSAPQAPEETIENDSTAQERPQIMVKYGVPYPRG